jgi:NAD+ synthase (glutamine-hydrolysing)
VVFCFEKLTGRAPRYRVHGGSSAENLALQNIQARLRMVFGYMLAQLLPWVRGRQGFLLVLASGNVDEGLLGYATKYDCSSGDVNPIGGVSKVDLKRFLLWAGAHPRLGVPALLEICEAPPTAELEPITAEYKQTDEADMGLTYEEIGVFGRLRKLERAGPVSMYQKARLLWAHRTPQEVADTVKRFVRRYSINRHKSTTITPSLHCVDYNADDNRFDHRPFLMNTSWPRQFGVIDRLAAEDAARGAGAGAAAGAVAPRGAKL